MYTSLQQLLLDTNQLQTTLESCIQSHEINVENTEACKPRDASHPMGEDLFVFEVERRLTSTY